ncbi:glycosyltransferase [Halomonas organivorans]
MSCVSVITPMHNASKFISTNIESVLTQTYSDWELIIIDDGSTDSSAEIAEAFSLQDSRIQLIRLEGNNGAAVARNRGIRLARGRYIAFLDSDDAWEPHKLESQLAFMKASEAALVFSAYRKVDEAGRELGVVGVPERAGYRDLLKTNYIGCLTAMYDTRRLGKVEMPLIRKRQDLALWLKILKLSGEPAWGQPEVLATYTVRAGSVSSNKQQAAAYQWRVYREVEALSLPACGYYFAQYALRGLLRSRLPGIARQLGVLH